MSEFVSIENEANAGTFEEETYELLEAAFEGWSPARGGLLVWLTKAWSRIGASVVEQASEMSRAAFKRFGEAIVAVPPVQAAPATAESTWTMVDKAGYTIPSGTQVSIEATGDTTVGFVTVGDVVVAPGADKAVVLLQAIEPGEAGNGLTADPLLVDSLAYVSAIELVAETRDGVDEEGEDAYLDRLVEELQTLSFSLVVTRDFETDAQAVPGIARAKCLAAYNIQAGKEEALAVSVIPIDTAGEASSAPVKEALKARQKAKLLSGINYYVGSPTYTSIKGKVVFEAEEGFDAATVKAAIEAFWAEAFSPARWGLPTQGDSGSGWINRLKAYRLKVIGEVERIGGVARVVTFEWAKGAGALETSEELTLEGVAPLTKPGTVTVSSA